MSLVLSYGEALVDFLPDRSGVPLREVETFSKTVGGAPANAAVGAARLGCEVALLGKLGADEFGHYLLEELARERIDVSAVKQTWEAKTGITFISLDRNGDRSFLFFREPSADMTIHKDDIDSAAIERATLMIAGSNLLTAEPVREATYFALEQARAHGTFVVLDPNVRLHLWRSPEDALEHVRRELDYGDVVKLNEEELEFLGGDPERLWNELQPKGARALVLTRAAAGARIYFARGVTDVAAPSIDVVDTTGAGDGFVAGLVSGLLRHTNAESSSELRGRVDEFEASDWERIVGLGCFVGTQVCTKLGATPALPRASEVPWDKFGL